MRFRVTQLIRELRFGLQNITRFPMPIFCRYQLVKPKSKNSEALLVTIYNTPENNTGDLCNSILSELTH